MHRNLAVFRIFRQILINSKQYRRHFRTQREIPHILVRSKVNFDNISKKIIFWSRDDPVMEENPYNQGLDRPTHGAAFGGLRRPQKNRIFLFFRRFLSISGPRGASFRCGFVKFPLNFDTYWRRSLNSDSISHFYRLKSHFWTLGPQKMNDLDETHLFGPSFIKFRLISLTPICKLCQNQ